jgi:hypothetical protein
MYLVAMKANSSALAADWGIKDNRVVWFQGVGGDLVSG